MRLLSTFYSSMDLQKQDYRQKMAYHWWTAISLFVESDRSLSSSLSQLWNRFNLLVLWLSCQWRGIHQRSTKVFTESVCILVRVQWQKSWGSSFPTVRLLKTLKMCSILTQWSAFRRSMGQPLKLFLIQRICLRLKWTAVVIILWSLLRSLI
jgi:hypothetical protein